MTLRTCCFVLVMSQVLFSQAEQNTDLKPADNSSVLLGYSKETSEPERGWEQKFGDQVESKNIRENMRRLSARPHHVGSPYDKDNAEWILAQFKSAGFDARIETFNVLFPTPKERVLELVEPKKFKAKLQEPVLPGDPTSNQTSEQLPTYNAYSADGDVTAPLVYVNYGNREDYEQLDRLGISVKGAIVIARYGEVGAELNLKLRLSTEPSDALCTSPGHQRRKNNNQDSSTADFLFGRASSSFRVERPGCSRRLARGFGHDLSRRRWASQGAPESCLELGHQTDLRRDRNFARH